MFTVVSKIGTDLLVVAMADTDITLHLLVADQIEPKVNLTDDFCDLVLIGVLATAREAEGVLSEDNLPDQVPIGDVVLFGDNLRCSLIELTTRATQALTADETKMLLAKGIAKTLADAVAHEQDQQQEDLDTSTATEPGDDDATGETAT